jgi:hypothetical protein
MQGEVNEAVLWFSHRQEGMCFLSHLPLALMKDRNPKLATAPVNAPLLKVMCIPRDPRITAAVFPAAAAIADNLDT